MWSDMICIDMICIDTKWYDMIWYDMIWYDMIWYDIIWYDMIWHDMIWYDMIWYDMIRYDMMYKDKIWHDTMYKNTAWCFISIFYHGTKWSIVIRYYILRWYPISRFKLYFTPSHCPLSSHAVCWHHLYSDYCHIPTACLSRSITTAVQTNGMCVRWIG